MDSVAFITHRQRVFV